VAGGEGWVVSVEERFTSGMLGRPSTPQDARNTKPATESETARRKRPSSEVGWVGATGLLLIEKR
jgi:hypothetical protein